jgi:serine phosphatase RsbU (regulator of sigma subunit)
MNAALEQFGTERLIGVVRDTITSSAAEIMAAIVEAAKEHAGPEPQYDDMTVVVVKRLP